MVSQHIYKIKENKKSNKARSQAGLSHSTVRAMLPVSPV